MNLQILIHRSSWILRFIVMEIHVFRQKFIWAVWLLWAKNFYEPYEFYTVKFLEGSLIQNWRWVKFFGELFFSSDSFLMRFLWKNWTRFLILVGIVPKNFYRHSYVNFKAITNDDGNAGKSFYSKRISIWNCAIFHKIYS